MNTWNGYVVRIGSDYLKDYRYPGSYPRRYLSTLDLAQVYAHHDAALSDARLFGGAVWSYTRAANGGFRGAIG